MMKYLVLLKEYFQKILVINVLMVVPLVLVCIPPGRGAGRASCKEYGRLKVRSERSGAEVGYPEGAYAEDL